MQNIYNFGQSDLWCNLPLLSGVLSRGLIIIIWWQYVVQKYRFWPFLGFFKPKNMITRPQFLSIWKLYSRKKTHWAHKLDTLYRVGAHSVSFYQNMVVKLMKTLDVWSYFACVIHLKKGPNLYFCTTYCHQIVLISPLLIIPDTLDKLHQRLCYWPKLYIFCIVIYCQWSDCQRNYMHTFIW